MSGPGILDASGQPMRPQRAQMLAGGSGVPYDAADNFGSHTTEWQPYLWSPDGEINIYRDKIVSRIRDLVRNDGWASAAVTRTVDTVIGADFRPVFKPDHRGLKAWTGIKAFDHKWAEEFGAALEACWRMWSMDPGRYCDVSRNLTVPQMMRLGFRHKVVDGDALAMLHWLPNRVAPGRALYATAVMMIDPDRLSNPQLRFDQMTMRGGVEIDEFGAATHYHIRRAHQGDWFSAAKAVTWDRIPRETAWGRPIIIHDFDHERAGQNRGGVGILGPVVQRLKMLIKYDGTELDAAIINSIFGAYIESPFDVNDVEEVLGSNNGLSAYQKERAAFHSERRISVGDVVMPTLFPGESIKTVAAARPNGNFEAFEAAVLRNVAAGAGTSPQQISQNWSDVNYSSYRAAMLEAWKTFHRRRVDFAVGFGQQMVMAFAEEAFDVDDLPLPAGAPDFAEFRGAYSHAKWMGPGKGYTDPVKEKAGAILGMDAGLSTLEEESSDLAGRDWREVLDQRAIEIDRMKELGIPLPSWAMGENAMKATQEPQPQ